MIERPQFTDDRERIFAAIRRGLRGVTHRNAKRDSRSPLKETISKDFRLQFERFEMELTALGGSSVIVPDLIKAANYIMEQTTKDERVFIYDDPMYASLMLELRNHRPTKTSAEFSAGYDRRDAAAFEVAISPCLACIAETGTIVVHNDMRLPAALATKLFIVAEADKMIPSLDDLFADRFISFKGSSLFLISGPSRTADIEKELVTGVHGPKEVHAIFTEKH